MTWAQGIECGVVVVWLAALVVKVALQRRCGVRSIVFSTDSTARRALEALMVGALFLWVLMVGIHGLGLLPALFEPRLFTSSATDAVGAALAIGGLGLGVAALWTMGRSWRIGIDRSTREELVTTGVFSFSRNPIFVSFDLLAVAVFLTSGSPFFLVTALLIATGVHLQILREEVFLAEAFGEKFEAYRRRVGRYLGRGRNELHGS